MSKIIKGSTKRGQQLIDMGSRYEGTFLDQVYDRWSTAKENAFDYCWDKYTHTPNSTAFGICSHNTFQFTVSWVGTYELDEVDENALFIETANNSYIVLLDK